MTKEQRRKLSSCEQLQARSTVLLNILNKKPNYGIQKKKTENLKQLLGPMSYDKEIDPLESTQNVEQPGFLNKNLKSIKKYSQQ
jgi:hypothetical protein